MHRIEPCKDDGQLREYIDTFWRKGHILAHDEKMFAFTYRTRWVDRGVFPRGTSVLGVYDDGGRMLGFLGAITAPYPRPTSYWLALWHVLPELKGTGMGGELLARMQDLALRADGWIGTFGAGPSALPVYLKRGFAVRAGRRWVYAPGDRPLKEMPEMRHSAERLPGSEWLSHRYEHHPVYAYDRRPGGVFRTETNEWGIVTHCVRLDEAWYRDVNDVYEAGAAVAKKTGRSYLMDAWAFECPGPGWTLAADDLPSVFHPPEARGNIIYAVGKPFVPTQIHKGDCDQDRPNHAQSGVPAAAAAH